MPVHILWAWSLVAIDNRTGDISLGSNRSAMTLYSSFLPFLSSVQLPVYTPVNSIPIMDW
uniref:Uncharacterized protein n=1 Tax=Amphimedon queenslandica TaxID=400682 RepID=A0A1X7VRY6_AMPQE